MIEFKEALTCIWAQILECWLLSGASSLSIFVRICLGLKLMIDLYASHGCNAASGEELVRLQIGPPEQPMCNLSSRQDAQIVTWQLGAFKRALVGAVEERLVSL